MSLFHNLQLKPQVLEAISTQAKEQATNVEPAQQTEPTPATAAQAPQSTAATLEDTLLSQMLPIINLTLQQAQFHSQISDLEHSLEQLAQSKSNLQTEEQAACQREDYEEAARLESKLAKVSAFISRKQSELLDLQEDLTASETKKCQMQKRIQVT